MPAAIIGPAFDNPLIIAQIRGVAEIQRASAEEIDDDVPYAVVRIDYGAALDSRLIMRNEIRRVERSVDIAPRARSLTLPK